MNHKEEWAVQLVNKNDNDKVITQWELESFTDIDTPDGRSFIFMDSDETGRLMLTKEEFVFLQKATTHEVMRDLQND